MSIIRLFRYITAVLLFAVLPFGAFAIKTESTGISKLAVGISKADYYQDKKGDKQERGERGERGDGGKNDKGGKKPEVKEVPQSRRQQKPGEVKQEKKEKPAKDNKRRN